MPKQHPYTCPACSRSLGSWGGYKSHMAVHRREAGKALAAQPGDTLFYTNALKKSFPVRVERITPDHGVYVVGPYSLDAFKAYPENLSRTLEG